MVSHILISLFAFFIHWKAGVTLKRSENSGCIHMDCIPEF